MTYDKLVELLGECLHIDLKWNTIHITMKLENVINVLQISLYEIHYYFVQLYNYTKGPKDYFPPKDSEISNSHPLTFKKKTMCLCLR